MIGKLVTAALLITVVAVIVRSVPDLKQYLELRNMQRVLDH